MAAKCIHAMPATSRAQPDEISRRALLLEVDRMELPLAEQDCRPLARGSPPLSHPALAALLERIDGSWRIRSGPELVRAFASDDYLRLVSLCSSIGALAQEQDHHPELDLRWGRLTVALSTHSIGGLSLNDFILAARIDRLASQSGF
jgi:4a-hydroxytetrahydrobiopterin dehydratase